MTLRTRHRTQGDSPNRHDAGRDRNRQGRHDKFRNPDFDPPRTVPNPEPTLSELYRNFRANVEDMQEFHPAERHMTGNGLDTLSQTSLSRGYNAAGAADQGKSSGTANCSNADSFNLLLEQFNDLQQMTMQVNCELQDLHGWNPYESMSKKDAIC